MTLTSVALSVLAFAASKYLGSGDFSDAVYSEIGVGSVGDIFKTGADSALSKIFKNPPPDFNKDQLNHHLNKAARKALLAATWYACRGVLLEYADDDGKKTEKEWLAKLADSLKEKIGKSLDEVPQTYITEAEIIRIFNAGNDSKVIEAKLIEKLRNEIYEVIQTDNASLTLFNRNGFALLKKNIEQGWTEQSSPISPIRKYDWFSLICGFFNDECKNPTIGFALQNKLFKKLLEGAGAYGKSFDELYKEIAEVKKTTLRTEGKTEFLIDYTKDFRTEVFYKLEEILEAIRSHGFTRINTEIARNLPNLDATVFGRDVESETIERAFCGKEEFTEKRFYTVVAPSGFGKSFTLIKTLQGVTDKINITPEYAKNVQRIIRINCKDVKSLPQIVSEFSNIIGLDIGYPNDFGFPFAFLNGVLFHYVRSVGKVWLILDNFENWLDGENEYRPLNRDIYAFLEALFKGNHTIRGVFLSQSALRFEADEHFETIENVGKMIGRGLPEDKALEMMRVNGKSVGLHDEPEERKIEFLKKTAYIPQAVTSLIGFLKSIKNTPNGTLQSVLTDFTKFDEHEQKDGETHTKYLISRQIKAQSSGVKLLLQAIAFFDTQVAYEALNLLANDEDISRLVEHNLATMSKDLRGSHYYTLHNYFSKQTRKTLPLFEEIFETESFADNLFKKSNNLYIHHYYLQAINIYECAEKIYKRFGFIENLERAYLNKGVSFRNLGKINEATAEYDKAINILKPLIENGNTELAEDLAKAYSNKGVSLDSVSRFNEAIVEYDKAINILKPLVENGIIKFANDLAKAYMNKGISLDHLLRLDEAITEYDKAIEILKPLVEKDITKFADDLAKAYINKGSAFYAQENFREAETEYDKSIGIQEKLIKEENRIQLTNELALSYWGKGNAVRYSGRIDESIKFYNKSIELLEETLRRGEIHNLPNTAIVLGIRFDILKETGNDDLAEKDMQRLHQLLEFTKQHEEIEHLGKYIQDVIDKWS